MNHLPTASSRKSFRIFKNCITRLLFIFQYLVFAFQCLVFFLKFSEPIFSLRLLITKRNYRRLMLRCLRLHLRCLRSHLRILRLHFSIIFHESRNFLFERWDAFEFFFRSRYWFYYHGVILPRYNKK